MNGCASHRETETSPRHIAIIMDGNGRWARTRGLPRVAGHKQGAESVRKIVKKAAAEGIEYLTLFGFSTENWKRPEAEVGELMKLLRLYLRGETAELHKNNIRLKIIGERGAFAPDICELIDHAERLTSNNDGLTVMMALNYGGRQDIAQAARHLMADYEGKALPSAQEIERVFDGYLSTAGVPAPDLLIRTSGEQRVSNFLLWQCAYAELYFTDMLWPDFDEQAFDQAIDHYARRDRRFGAISAEDRG